MKKGVNWSLVGGAIMGVLSLVIFVIGFVGCAA